MGRSALNAGILCHGHIECVQQMKHHGKRTLPMGRAFLCTMHRRYQCLRDNRRFAIGTGKHAGGILQNARNKAFLPRWTSTGKKHTWAQTQHTIL